MLLGRVDVREHVVVAEVGRAGLKLRMAILELLLARKILVHDLTQVCFLLHALCPLGLVLGFELFHLVEAHAGILLALAHLLVQRGKLLALELLSDTLGSALQRGHERRLLVLIDVVDVGCLHTVRQVVVSLGSLSVKFLLSLLLSLPTLLLLNLGGFLKSFGLGGLVALFVVAEVLLYDDVPVILGDVEGRRRVLIGEQLVAVERVWLLHCRLSRREVGHVHGPGSCSDRLRVGCARAVRLGIIGRVGQLANASAVRVLDEAGLGRDHRGALLGAHALHVDCEGLIKFLQSQLLGGAHLEELLNLSDDVAIDGQLLGRDDVELVAELVHQQHSQLLLLLLLDSLDFVGLREMFDG